jgi:hypothetical protein
MMSATRRAWIALAAAAVADVAAVVLVRAHAREHPRVSSARSKGDIDLLVFARKSGRVEMLDRFNRGVRPGDDVRFVLTGTPEGQGYVLVASVDGAGKPNVYFPFDGDESAPLPGPGRWEVPGSIELDDTLGPERVFAFFSPRPLDAAEVRTALAGLGSRGPNAVRDAQMVDLAGTTQRSFLMMKEPKAAR